MLHLKTKYHMCWCVCYFEGTLKQFDATFNTHAKNKFNTLKSSQPQFLHKAKSSFCPSTVHTNMAAQNQMRESSRPRQPQGSHRNKNEGVRPANSTQKDLSFNSFFLGMSMLGTTLSASDSCEQTLPGAQRTPTPHNWK